MSELGHRVPPNIELAVLGESPAVGVHERTKRKIFVEAKGGTSSKEKTNRYGKGFTPNQAKSHVSVALYCAARLHETADAEGADIALAFPDDATHRKLVKNIEKALSALNVAVYFVAEDRTVATMKESASAQPGAAADGARLRRALPSHAARVRRG